MFGPLDPRPRLFLSSHHLDGIDRVVPETGSRPNRPYNPPGINAWNLSLFKNFPMLGEGRYLQFRVELWNAFNHPNFALGSGTVFASTANATTLPGYVTPGTSQFLDKTIFSGGGANAPFQRIIQWGLKFVF